MNSRSRSTGHAGRVFSRRNAGAIASVVADFAPRSNTFRGCYKTPLKMAPGCSECQAYSEVWSFEVFRSARLEGLRQLGRSDDVRHTLDVVGHDRKTRFDACAASSSQQEARVSEDAVLDGGERGARPPIFEVLIRVELTRSWMRSRAFS